jgi:hypothetical protein
MSRGNNFPVQRRAMHPECDPSECDECPIVSVNVRVRLAPQSSRGAGSTRSWRDNRPAITPSAPPMNPRASATARNATVCTANQTARITRKDWSVTREDGQEKERRRVL